MSDINLLVYYAMEPDLIEEQIKNYTPQMEENSELNNRESITAPERIIIETPKRSRWDLLQPDKKDNNSGEETKPKK